MTTTETTTTDDTTIETAGTDPVEMRDAYMRNIIEHIRLVGAYLHAVTGELTRRAIEHDTSKFEEPEFSGYLSAYPLFCRAEYGSAEYLEACRKAFPAIQHHVMGNDHHPEYFGDAGVNGMDLIQLIEMVADWMAAAQRGGGTLADLDLRYNFNRFMIGPQLAHIIENTVETLGGVEV